jgi:Caspase domain
LDLLPGGINPATPGVRLEKASSPSKASGADKVITRVAGLIRAPLRSTLPRFGACWERLVTEQSKQYAQGDNAGGGIGGFAPPPGDIAFVFFAGHGVTISGGNYLLPSDVPNAESGQETRLARAAIGENDIVADLQQRSVRVAVVVLDACRDNPFRRPGVRSVGGDRGLGRIEPVRGVSLLSRPWTDRAGPSRCE